MSFLVKTYFHLRPLGLQRVFKLYWALNANFCALGALGEIVPILNVYSLGPMYSKNKIVGD